jgi:hypothetical protein
LEPGFEPGKRFAVVGAGRVALHDRIERHAADARSQVGDPGEDDRRTHATERGRTDASNRDQHDGRGEHRLLAQATT